MDFSSATYLIFLVLVYVTYWQLRSRSYQNGLLAAASYLFYAWWDPRFCLLMLASTLVDFFCAIGIAKKEDGFQRRLLLIISLVANLGLLGLFKYFNFFQDSLIAGFAQLGIDIDGFAVNLILPVGISFYTFQTLSYTIDVYRRKLDATRSFIDYLVYVSFFPQLVAGPIERGSRMMPQILQARTFDASEVFKGFQQIVWGLFKKVAIASNVASIVDTLFEDIGSRSGPELWIAGALFAIQIYCDFSGYSDIAIGSARLFGIRLMRNFACPYFSQSLKEFWRRWHISLSTWFRDYVFIPLGGSRVSAGRVHFNVFLVFVISGLWHGASWNFVIWGAIHGGLLVLESLFLKTPQLKSTDPPGGDSFFPGLAALSRMSVLFIVVVIAWVFFRVTEFNDATLAIQKMFTDWRKPQLEGLSFTFTFFHGLVTPSLLLFIEWISRKHEVPFFALNRTPIFCYLVVTFFIWATFWLRIREVGEFIYFQF